MRGRNGEDARLALWIFAALFMTLAFIGPGYEGVKNNAAPRLGLVFSLITDHSLIIDRYLARTPDMSLFNGHYYAAQAPGLSFMATPFVAALVGVTQLLGISAAPIADGDFTPFALLASYVAAAATSGLWAALTACALFLSARRMGLSRFASLFGALAYGVASPAFGWASMFVGHVVAGSCMFLAFALIASAETSERIMLRGAAVGALLTWGCVVEYTTGLGAILLGLFALWRIAFMPTQARLPAIGGAVLGGAVALLPLLAYNALAFGNPFMIGYQYQVGFDEMKQGTMGFSLPKLAVAGELLFGTYRGILWLSPMLAVLPLAWWAAARRFQADAATVLIALPVAILLMNSSFFYWWAGASTGPRYFVPALAFVGLPFAALWDWSRASARPVLLVLLLISAGLSLVCASTTMAAPNTVDQPLMPYLWDEFVHGRTHNLLTFFLGRGVAHLSLLAIPVIWAVTYVAAGAVVRLPRRPRAAEAVTGAA